MRVNALYPRSIWLTVRTLLASASTRRLRVSIGSAPLARMSRCSRFLDDLGIGDVMDQLIGPVTLRVADPPGRVGAAIIGALPEEGLDHYAAG
jgi:hypothetical protein